jgi:coenzyme F420-reducing hydrogenase delta subunit
MIQVELKPKVEARLVAGALASGMEQAVYAGAVIERAYYPGNGSPKASRSPQEVRAWLDSLAQFSDKIPQLPDEAFKRESFYRDSESMTIDAAQ